MVPKRDENGHTAMKILFVYSSLEAPGGIETLIRRACQYLSEHGHQVTLLLQDEPNITERSALYIETSRYAKIHHVKGWFRRASNSLQSLKLQGFDFIYAFESATLLLALLIQSEFLPNTPIATGVYFSREYCWASKYKRFQQALVEDIFRKMPVKNIFFMSKECAQEHGNCLNRDFGQSPIIPLPIDVGRYAHIERRINKSKIVSIGRITDFKTYNFLMLDVLERLIAKGYTLEYHIYGDGEQTGKLQQMVLDRGLQDKVVLHGTIPYTQMEHALHDAFVFVGMGTSVLEAAAAGIPSVVAIESSRNPITYGMVHEDGGEHLGYVDKWATEEHIEDKIEMLLQLSQQEYDEVSRQTKVAASRYAMDAVMGKFVETLSNIEPFSYQITPSMKRQDHFDLWRWRLLKRLGYEDPNKNRFVS